MEYNFNEKDITDSSFDVGIESKDPNKDLTYFRCIACKFYKKQHFKNQKICSACKKAKIGFEEALKNYPETYVVGQFFKKYKFCIKHKTFYKKQCNECAKLSNELCHTCSNQPAVKGRVKCIDCLQKFKHKKRARDEYKEFTKK